MINKKIDVNIYFIDNTMQLDCKIDNQEKFYQYCLDKYQGNLKVYRFNQVIRKLRDDLNNLKKDGYEITVTIFEEKEQTKKDAFFIGMLVTYLLEINILPQRGMSLLDYLDQEIKKFIDEVQLEVKDNENEFDCVDRFRNFLKLDAKTFFINRFNFHVCDKEDADFIYEGKYYFIDKKNEIFKKLN